MDPQKSNMTVLAQIVKQIPAKIIDSLAKKFRIQTGPSARPVMWRRFCMSIWRIP